MTRLDHQPIAATAAWTLGEFDTFLARLGDRDRQNVERHLAFCETEPTDAHEKLWKRLICTLARLAPHAANTTGQRAVRFFVSDGKYRRQLFALEDLRDGTLAIYAGDALQTALDLHALSGPVSTDGDVCLFECPDDNGQPLRIEVLSAAKTTSAPEYFKHMLGWNRKALRIGLPVGAGPGCIRAVETLCILSARKIDGLPVPTTA